MARISEVINLPSNGKLYKTNKVTIQNMTVAEEKYIYGSSDENAIDKIISKCVVDENFDLGSLIVQDKYYILVRLRVLTYGEDYSVNLTCNGCGNTHEHTVKLSTLEINELPNDFKEPVVVTLPKSGDVIEFHIPRCSEVDRYRELATQKSSKYNLDYDEVLYIYLSMLGISSVNNEELLDDELYSYVSEMHALDAAYLKHQMSKIDVGYNNRLTTKCPVCGRTITYRLPMNTEFFLTRFDD